VTNFFFNNFSMASLCTLGVDIGFKNFSYCVYRTQRDTHTGHILDWQNISLIDPDAKYNCKTMKLHHIHEIYRTGIIPLLSRAYFDHFEITHVAIEQQPHGKYCNVKMVILANLIYAHCFQLLPDNVCFTPPNRKYTKRMLRHFGIQRSGRGYKHRKLLSIKMMHMCVPPTLEIFQSASKCDDLADSFLIALVSSPIHVNSLMHEEYICTFCI